MKITNSNINLIHQAYSKNTDLKTGKQKPEAVKPGSKPADNVNLSSTTKDLQKVFAAMDNQPTQRAEKVEELKSMFKNGQYTVDPEKVAEKMVGTFLDISS